MQGCRSLGEMCHPQKATDFGDDGCAGGDSAGRAMPDMGNFDEAAFQKGAAGADGCGSLLSPVSSSTEDPGSTDREAGKAETRALRASAGQAAGAGNVPSAGTTHSVETGVRPPATEAPPPGAGAETPHLTASGGVQPAGAPPALAPPPPAVSSANLPVAPPTSDAPPPSNPRKIEIKLFVGRLPTFYEESEVRPLFERFGEVVEVAIIRDKFTGAHKGSCFVRIASITDADAAIRALRVSHPQLLISYATGEPERLGFTPGALLPGEDEAKLFVGSLPPNVTESEVEAFFQRFGRAFDCYLMRHSQTQKFRGCCFLKLERKEDALLAIKELHGVVSFPGAQRRLEVKIAEPKRTAPSPFGKMPVGVAQRILAAPLPSLAPRVLHHLEAAAAAAAGSVGASAAASRGAGSPRAVGPHVFAAREPVQVVVPPGSASGDPWTTSVVEPQFAQRMPPHGAAAALAAASAPDLLSQVSSSEHVLIPGVGGHRSSPPPPPHYMGLWKKYFSSEGRAYYHNEVTGGTQWTAPAELLCDVLNGPDTMAAAAAAAVAAANPTALSAASLVRSGGAEGSVAGGSSSDDYHSMHRGPVHLRQPLEEVGVGGAGYHRHPQGGSACSCVSLSEHGGPGESAGPGGAQIGPPGANTFIFHLPSDWTVGDLTRAFSHCGPLLSAKVALDKTTGRNRGYGFVSFATVDGALRAVLTMNGVLVEGKRLRVTIKNGEEHAARCYASARGIPFPEVPHEVAARHASASASAAAAANASQAVSYDENAAFH